VPANSIPASDPIRIIPTVNVSCSQGKIELVPYETQTSGSTPGLHRRLQGASPGHIDIILRRQRNLNSSTHVREEIISSQEVERPTVHSETPALWQVREFVSHEHGIQISSQQHLDEIRIQFYFVPGGRGSSMLARKLETG
jgi:hypothetical protein